ncbi:MAG: tetratricopeptide repeat protein [Flammeovirgaceae bacterium]
MNKRDAEVYYNKADEITSIPDNERTNRQNHLALEFINKAIALNPAPSKYYSLKGVIQIDLDNYQAAIPSYTKAIEKDVTNYLAWMGLGVAYKNLGNYKLAEQHYLKALDYNPNSSNTHYNLGKLYGDIGKIDLALTQYSKAINAYPKHVNAYVSRGVLKIDQRDYQSALEDLNTAIELDPANKIAFNNRGLCKYYLKQYKAAIFDLKRSLEKEGDATPQNNSIAHSYAYNNIANCYFAIKDQENACKYWKLAIAHGYQYRAEWKELYDIDDPVELIKKHCK